MSCRSRHQWSIDRFHTTSPIVNNHDMARDVACQTRVSSVKAHYLSWATHKVQFCTQLEFWQAVIRQNSFVVFCGGIVLCSRFRADKPIEGHMICVLLELWKLDNERSSSTQCIACAWGEIVKDSSTPIGLSTFVYNGTRVMDVVVETSQQNLYIMIWSNLLI